MITSLINSLKIQLSQFQYQNPHYKTQYHYISLEIPLKKPVSLASVKINDSFFLTKPDSGFTLVGLGSLVRLQASGPERFEIIKYNYSNIMNSWGNKNHCLPTAFLAFAFDDNDPMSCYWEPFPNSLLSIPIILIKETDSHQTLLVNIKIDQDSYEPSFKNIEALLKRYFLSLEQISKTTVCPTDGSLLNTADGSLSSTADGSWRTLFHAALKEIETGHCDKLVASRQLSIQAGQPVCVANLIKNLIKHYPTCSIFSHRQSGSTLVSASPERLLTLNNHIIHSDAIGGTIKKNKSSNIRSASPLLMSQAIFQMAPDSSHRNKLLKEHAFIAQDIVQRLDPICDSLKIPVSPFLMKLHNMYHLESPIQGKLMENYDFFDVLKTLHPTPAVAGFPAHQARQWLLAHEPYQRGWYTGGFGWLDNHNSGEISVTLRCALVKDKHLNLFSGAGLVAGSDVNIEWQETELKIQTILEML